MSIVFCTIGRNNRDLQTSYWSGHQAEQKAESHAHYWTVMWCVLNVSKYGPNSLCRWNINDSNCFFVPLSISLHLVRNRASKVVKLR
jgi:hypothetical protein